MFNINANLCRLPFDFRKQNHSEGRRLGDGFPGLQPDFPARRNNVCELLQLIHNNLQIEIKKSLL